MTIGRREFITLLGGAAAWPLAARARQGDRMRRIGVLVPASSNDSESQTRLKAFREGLEQFGWSDGRNIHLEYRWAEGNTDDIRRDVAELVALAPDVILTAGSAPVAALQKATRSVPIVFATAGDPVGAGFVDSLARPGGNITGFAVFEYSIGGMAGVAQRNFSANDARGGTSRPRRGARTRPVRRDPDGGAIVWD